MKRNNNRHFPPNNHRMVLNDGTIDDLQEALVRANSPEFSVSTILGRLIGLLFALQSLSALLAPEDQRNPWPVVSVLIPSTQLLICTVLALGPNLSHSGCDNVFRLLRNLCIAGVCLEALNSFVSGRPVKMDDSWAYLNLVVHLLFGFGAIAIIAEFERRECIDTRYPDSEYGANGRGT